MGSLGLPATAMAVRSAFALLCFALLCGLAASSVGQSETETELTKTEGEAAGNQVLVPEALESRVARGSNEKKKKSEACRRDPQSKKCRRQKTRTNRTRGKAVQSKKDKSGKEGKVNKKSEACRKNPKSKKCRRQKTR